MERRNMSRGEGHRAMVEASKWAGLVGGMWVQAFAGNAYTFAHFSETLKHTLHYSQIQLNNLGVAKDFGENIGILPGLLCNRLHPSLLLSIGALNGFLGYGTLWLVASHRIDKLPYWLMCVALFLGANSSTWFNTAVLVTCMRNFPHSRGTVVGFLKGFVGLSGAIFTQLFIGFLSKDPVRLLLLLTVGPTIVCLVSMGFVRPIAAHDIVQGDPHERTNFCVVNVICLALAFFLLLATLLGDLIPLSDRFISRFVTTVMLVLLASPAYVPLRMLTKIFARDREVETSHYGNGVKTPLTIESHLQKSEGDNQEIQEEGLHVVDVARSSQFPLEAENMIDEGMLLAAAQGAIIKRKRGPRRGQDFELNQALVKADFWLLFITFFCGVGTGVTAINNLGQIGAAQGYSDVTVFVTLIGVFNFLGRLGGGAISEYYIRSSATPRPLWMAAAQAFMIVAHLLFASAIKGSLVVASSILGFCYGVHFSVMVPTASELFGLKHFGIIYNVITMADPVGSFLFSGILAGYVYDWESEKQQLPSGMQPEKPELLSGMQLHLGVTGKWFRATDVSCTGAHCFRLTFMVLAGVCVVGVIFSIILTSRIKIVYKSLYGTRDSTNDVSVLPLAKELS